MKKAVLPVALSIVLLAGIGAALLFFHPKPQYCVLAFGPKANLRVLVCLKGKRVYIDRNGDGEFTGPQERFSNVEDCRDVMFADPDGNTSYIITQMDPLKDKDSPRKSLIVDVDIKGPLEYEQYCDVELTDSRARARVAHFHGLLTVEARKILWKLPPKLALHRGDKPTRIVANVGTMNAENGCWVVVRTMEGKDHPTFPEGVHPFVDVEFPPRNNDDPPLKRRYPLDGFC